MRILTQTGLWIIHPEYRSSYYNASFIELVGIYDGKGDCALYFESGDRVKDIDQSHDGYMHEIPVEDIVNDAVPATIDQTCEIRSITWAKDGCVSDAEETEEDE